MLQNYGPFSRVTNIMETAGHFGLILLGVVILLCVAIILTRQHFIAICALLVAMILSLLGEPLHSMFDIARWIMVFMLIPMGLAGIFQLGAMYWLLWVNAILSIIFMYASPHLLWSVQMSSLLLAMLIGYTGSLIKVVQAPNDLLRLFHFFGVLGLVLGLINIGLFAGGYGTEAARFGGVGVSPGQLSMVFGILVCFCVWLSDQGRNALIRGFWIVVAGLLVISIVLSTQRTGILLAVVSLIYYLVQKPNKQTLRRIGLMVVLSALLISGLMLISSERREYIFQRFAGEASGLGATSGRVDIWKTGLSACMKQPLTGHGAGSDTIQSQLLMGHSFHNAYLSIWYNSGIFGVGTVMLVLFGTFWQASRLSKLLRNETMGSEMRLLAGLVLGIIASGFFERALAGNANLLVAIVLLTLVATRTLKNYVLLSPFGDDQVAHYATDSDMLVYPNDPQDKYLESEPNT